MLTLSHTFNDWKSSPEAVLQCIFFVHFLFSAWSELGNWAGNVLLFQNSFFLIVVLWAIHDRRSPSPVIVAIGINVMLMFLDIIVLAIGFPSRNSTREFSAVMAAFNLVLRAVSTFLLFRQLWSRDPFDPHLETGHQGAGGPHAIDVISGNAVSRSTSRVTNNNQGHYGGSTYQTYPAPPKQELPPIPPSYTEHS